MNQPFTPPIGLPWPDWLDGVWAKSPRSGQPCGETLAAHTWQALLRLRDLRRLRPALADDLGQPAFWSSAFWSVLLHDPGKCAPGFQAKLRPDRRRSPAAQAWGAHRHEVFSLAFVDWVFPEPSEQRAWVIAAIASHHRDYQDIEQTYPPEADDQLEEVLNSLSDDLIAGLYDWLAGCAWPWAEHLGFADLCPRAPLLPKDEAVRSIKQSGRRAIRRALDEFSGWLRRLGPAQARPPILLRGLITQSDHAASAYVGAIRPVAGNPQALRQRWTHISNYNRYQEQASATDGSALLIAPTGSGKTEAALLWATHQQGIPRLFYVLPYQASINAMCRRLRHAFHPRDVHMQHGRGLLALYRLLMESEPDADPRAVARRARWGMNLVRLHHAPVQVFSPYQMLKAMYRLKGFEGMLTDFYGGAFIFDEIHAYEPARLALIVETIRYLREQFAARFFVMSATFPRLIRNALDDALGQPALIQADPQLYQAHCRHHLRLLEGDLFDPQNWQRVIAEAKAGRMVLICVNTVRRAQEAFRRLRAELPEAKVLLLHSRFNMRDRSERESFIRRHAGLHAQRAPLILVATQVVEVSLDIDFDVIFSDPAPLEALVQRFGRVNRRGRIRPAAPVFVLTEPVNDRRPYPADLIRAALDVLKGADGASIQEDQVGAWLDQIYTGPIEAQWQEAYRQAQQEFIEACVHTLRPFQSDPGIEELFYRAFDGLEVLPLSLKQEYKDAMNQNPILAQELLVPIRYRQFYQLKNSGRVSFFGSLPVVNLPYDPNVGLDMSPQDADSVDAD